ncbi:neuroserpin-like [Anopheles ziemanni]|uniref:neuroserpin-like n=1 Tax=Anopheles coustani TaxID=139045 RepID=UPI0026582198|nr:neuroserpin-like [Anopheles coustani]XP_058169359.1 neuroserpin-like [Anopheles ziemanni]
MNVPEFRVPAFAVNRGQVCFVASLFAALLCTFQQSGVYGNPQIRTYPTFPGQVVYSRFDPDNQRQPSDYPIQFPNQYDQEREVEDQKPHVGPLHFAFDMLKTYVLPQQTNAAICPILPQTLLATLYDVADGGARMELLSALKATPQALQPIVQKQLLATNRSGVNELDYAMAYFIGADTKIQQDIYRRGVENGVSFQKVDFRKQNEAASIANRWVTDKTRGLIREIVAPGGLDPATRLMMASVIYFKGKWKYQFIDTKQALFETAPGGQRTLQVPMMYQYNKLRYGEVDFRDGNGMRWVELPYEGTNGLSMVLMVPKQRHQLDRSLENLSLSDMSNVMEQLTAPRVTNKVHLYVPRFSVYSSSSLVPVMKSLGLRSIFDRSTALSGLSNEELVVRDITQRTFISVDEEGTTATSVVSLSFVALSAVTPPPAINFTVDEPFLVMIVDKIHSYPMFVAKVAVPEKF